MTTASRSIPAATPAWRLPAAWVLVAALATLSHAGLGQGPLLWRPVAPVPTAAEPSGVDPGDAIEAMVQRLADRLASQADDVEGWRRLARAYEALERHDAAVAAYRQLLRQQPQDADALCELALVLALQQGERRLQGEAAALVRQALQADPNHLQALALAGGIALEAGRPQEARRLWQRVLDQVPPGTDLARHIQASMDRASAARP